MESLLSFLKPSSFMVMRDGLTPVMIDINECFFEFNPRIFVWRIDHLLSDKLQYFLHDFLMLRRVRFLCDFTGFDDPSVALRCLAVLYSSWSSVQAGAGRTQWHTRRPDLGGETSKDRSAVLGVQPDRDTVQVYSGDRTGPAGLGGTTTAASLPGRCTRLGTCNFRFLLF